MDEADDTGLASVDVCAAQLLMVDCGPRDGGDDVRACDEEVRGALDGEDEVGEGGRVGGTAGARAQHDADLGDAPGARDIALEDAAESGERGDALLDAGPCAVAQAHDGMARRHGEVIELVDLFGVRAAERAAEDPEVVGVGEDASAVDHAPAGDDAVGVVALVLETESARLVATEPLELVEDASVEKQLNALACGELAARVLGLRRSGARAVDHLATEGSQFGWPRLVGHGAQHTRLRRSPGERRPEGGPVQPLVRVVTTPVRVARVGGRGVHRSALRDERLLRDARGQGRKHGRDAGVKGPVASHLGRAAGEPQGLVHLTARDALDE